MERPITASSMKGTYTALVTPFTSEGHQIDFEALDALVERQIAGGVSGLVPCGTTGETPTLSAAEQKSVIARVVKAAKGRVPVFAGVVMLVTSAFLVVLAILGLGVAGTLLDRSAIMG